MANKVKRPKRSPFNMSFRASEKQCSHQILPFSGLDFKPPPLPISQYQVSTTCWSVIWSPTYRKHETLNSSFSNLLIVVIFQWVTKLTYHNILFLWGARHHHSLCSLLIFAWITDGAAAAQRTFLGILGQWISLLPCSYLLQTASFSLSISLHVLLTRPYRVHVLLKTTFTAIVSPSTSHSHSVCPQNATLPGTNSFVTTDDATFYNLIK